MTTQHRSVPQPAIDPADTEPIPDIDTAMLPFDSTDELRQRWRALMGPLGFGESRLWVAFVADARIVPPLSHLPLPSVPSPDRMDLFMRRMAELVRAEPQLSLALLFSRPGRGGITPRDIGWTRLAVDAAARYSVPIHPIHRAGDDKLVTMPDAADAAA
ncbi:hypothetical protein GCM10009624_05950 [Gordonia sinesedis]